MSDDEPTMTDLLAVIPNKGDVTVWDGWRCENLGHWPYDGACDRLVASGDRTTNCPKPVSWRAPVDDPRFPMAYCDDHKPLDV